MRKSRFSPWSPAAGLILAFGVLVGACADDDVSVPTTQSPAPSTTPLSRPTTVATTASLELTDGEREWCSFSTATEDDALRFDLIFEAGLRLRLNMDLVNARANGLRADYEAQGLSSDEAVRAVSEDLFAMEEFVTACRAAYVEFGPGAES